jgi:hypothetical protein
MATPRVVTGESPVKNHWLAGARKLGSVAKLHTKFVVTVLDLEGHNVEGEDRNKTRLHETPVGAGAGSATAQTVTAPAAGGNARTGTPAAPLRAAASAPALPVGQFSPPAHRRQRGLASRSPWPVALSFGTAFLVAIALVIYFSAHT